jgi:MFS transporter, UMF1 family
MKNLKKSAFNKATFSWALGDWANSAYTTTVIAVFFPIFFKQYWAANLIPTESTFYLGLSNSINSVILFAVAPFLGALADISGRKKTYLMFFTAIGALTLIAFYFIQQGSWAWALAFYTISNVGYWISNIFYDALIMNVSEDENISFVSSLGYSLGYLGGGLLIVLNAWAVASPATFGLPDAAAAVKWSFLSVAVWWILFSIPLYIYVPEQGNDGEKVTFRKTFGVVFNTIKKMKEHRNLFLFLLAYIFYIDGVNTIIKMAVDFALSIGLNSSDLIKAIILVQFIGFPATLIYAWIAHKIGDRRSLFIGLGIYASATVFSYFISTSREFYMLAIVIGLAQGGLQAISRSYFGRMTPKAQSGEFFGIYNMVGKFSAILGPLFIGLMNLWTKNPRVSILVILIFFAIGAFFLAQVREEEAAKLV